MKSRIEFTVFVLALAAAVPLVAQGGDKQPFEVTSTTRSDFAPGGAVRIDNSYGYLTVEGWDEPQVEVTVAKSTDRFYDPRQKERATQRLNQIVVKAQRRSDKEFAISTWLPGRAFPLLPRTKRRITVEYRVRVPRDSRLLIHQDNGYVWVSDVMGDIEVHSHTGDMIVALADPGPYTIDAITRFGSVTSDFAGRHPTKFLVGTHFLHSPEDPGHKVLLRMGRGSITLKKGRASVPFWRD
jgi:hypothetical protein